MSGLFISALTLSHFRSHRLARLEADGRPVALFGPNGAGKTNLLEAISLLSPGRGLRRAEAEALARQPEGIGWKISARLETPDGPHEAETFADPPGAPRAVRIDGKPAPQTRLGALVRMVWLTPAMDRLWTDGAAERRRFLDRIALGFAPGHADAALAYEKAMRERNRLLRDGVRDARWLAALEGRMAEAGAALAAGRVRAVARLSAAQEGAETAFPAAALSLEGAPEAALAAALAEGRDPAAERTAAADALAEALARGRARDFAAGRTLHGPHRSDLRAIYAAKGMEARLCSTGEQKALLISLVLGAARALAQDFGAPPLLLLDEVAAHLDAARREALFDEVCALGAQAWLTGAGAESFEALGPRAQRFEVTERDGSSTLSPR